MPNRFLTLVALAAALSACSGGPSDVETPSGLAQTSSPAEVSAVLAEPGFDVTVTANPFGLELGGAVLDGATRDSLILAAYNAGYPDGAVIDRLTIDPTLDGRARVTVDGALAAGEGDFHRSWLAAWTEGQQPEVVIAAEEHPGDPLVVLAVFGDKSVTLEGEVASEAHRQFLVAASTDRFGADALDASRLTVSLADDAGYRLVRAVGTIRTPDTENPLSWLRSWADENEVTIWAGDLVVVAVSETEGDLERLLATNPITFEPGSTDLTVDSRETIAAAAALLRGIGVTSITVEGHTDNQGLASSNLELSQSRADAVRDALVGHGFDAAIITATGRGSLDPIAGNDTEEGRAKNRRIELDYFTTG